MSGVGRLGFVVVDWPGIQRATPGIARKIKCQMKAFANAGFDVELVGVEGHSTQGEKLLDRLPFYSDYGAWRAALAPGYRALYIRRPSYVSAGMLRALGMYRHECPGAPVVFEVPTWPYDAEDRTWRRLPLHVKDLMHRRRLGDVVDRVADLSCADSILGIPTLPIINGIDFDDMPSRSPSGEATSVINLMFVAAFARWHGADRVLQGMAAYRREGEPAGPVHLELIGDGPELASLRRLADDLDVSSMVTFRGMLGIEDIARVYDRRQMGIASLGLHRIGLDRASTLKTREYLAKGLPFVYSGSIDVFEGRDVDFCLRVPADESPLDIEQVVRFYRSLVSNRTERELVERIRKFAELHVSMDAAMETVSRYFQSNLSINAGDLIGKESI